jgi:DNA-binding transcriptional regulator YhcF (GntR family)
MSSENIYSLITFNEYSVTPKYLQLTNCILKGIQENKIQKDYILPSINDLSFEFDISRNTVEKAYKHLKEIGVINSVPGKGYFVSKTDLKKHPKIFLLFNKLSTHKKIIYDSFAEALGENAAIDFYIYNNNFSLFKELLKNNKEDYSHYVIIPHFLEGGEAAHEIINAIPKDKLILMDKLLPQVNGNYGAVFEDFEKDIYDALEQALEQLKKYHTIKIIFPEYTYHPQEIVKGFRHFCYQYAFNNEVVHDISSEIIQEGTVYITLMENDLVIMVEKIIDAKMKIGKQVGVISYNETPLKKIILNGITTISTDFDLMGRKAAQLITEKSTAHISIPFSLTLRDSL